MIDTGLEDRVVLITGGNHGIGAAAARAFAAQGARVFITYLRLSPQDYGIDPEEARRASEPGLPLYHATQTRSADEVVREIREGGGMAESWETDLSNSATIPQLFDRAEETLGPVTVLVNNAAYCETPLDTIFSTSTGSIDEHFAVNTRAAVLLMAELVRRHNERGGRWGRVLASEQTRWITGQVIKVSGGHAI
jgi:3-oxoacyl-[acyl-carrier protein] reductase